MTIRDAALADYPEILALNQKLVRFLSPMDEALLSSLHRQAKLLKVMEENGKLAAFLIVLAEGADYGSENYRWFSKQYPHFLYVDRIVVDDGVQARGVGSLFYGEVFRYAAENGFPVVTAEIDVQPPNPVSLNFHAKHGFREVGRQWVHGGEKQVSLQAAILKNIGKSHLPAGGKK